MRWCLSEILQVTDTCPCWSTQPDSACTAWQCTITQMATKLRTQQCGQFIEQYVRPAKWMDGWMYHPRHLFCQCCLPAATDGIKKKMCSSIRPNNVAKATLCSVDTRITNRAVKRRQIHSDGLLVLCPKTVHHIAELIDSRSYVCCGKPGINNHMRAYKSDLKPWNADSLDPENLNKVSLTPGSHFDRKC